MRWTLVLALGFVLGACCFGADARSSAPEPVAPAASIVAPIPSFTTGPSAPGCPDLSVAIVGAWTREGVSEEYRADGTYTLNGRPGTVTWIRPGHAMIDVPSAAFHMEYDVALADAMTLVSSDPSQIGAIATRTTPPPAIPATCFDLSAAWVGTWTPVAGGESEQYSPDGTYAAPGIGRWSFSAPGRLHLVNVDGAASDYVLGMATTSSAIAVSLPPLGPLGVVYTRAR